MLEEEWSQRAELDIQSIVIFLAVECKNLQAARKAEEKILAAIDMLKEFPDMGGTLKDDSLKRSYRTMLVHPYAIYYTYDEKTRSYDVSYISVRPWIRMPWSISSEMVHEATKVYA